MTRSAHAGMVADRFRPFGTTIFAEMTALAVKHKAVNLSQGFPDFDGPEMAKRAAVRAMDDGHNQYAPLAGVATLREAIAGWYAPSGLVADPETEITVTNGCTGALPAAFLGLVNPGDEVVLFEPFYDSYRACIAMAGATPRFVTLTPGPDGRFSFDEQVLRDAFSDRTAAVLVNTPHNPTGKVFTRDELSVIAELCIEHDAIAIADEVYERLVYEPDRPHISIATLPGMRRRTLTLSSLGKTFSLTGWKIGWAVGPPDLTTGLRSAHQFLSYAIATPLQHGAAEAIRHGGTYVHDLVSRYTDNRRFLCGVLEGCGFEVFEPEGSYFIMAGHAAVSERLGVSGDVELCRALTADVGVAAIPPSAFYDNPEHGRPFVRFAFCKRRATLEQAAERLERALT